MTSFRMVIEGVPVPKGRPRFGRGHVYTPLKTKNAEALISTVGKKMMAGKKPFTGPVKVDATFMVDVPKSWPKKRQGMPINDILLPTSARVGDVDNLLKTVTDAINGIVYEDDRQIITATATKLYTAKGSARTIIEIEEIDTLPDIPTPLDKHSIQ